MLERKTISFDILDDSDGLEQVLVWLKGLQPDGKHEIDFLEALVEAVEKAIEED